MEARLGFGRLDHHNDGRRVGGVVRVVVSLRQPDQRSAQAVQFQPVVSVTIGGTLLVVLAGVGFLALGVALVLGGVGVLVVLGVLAVLPAAGRNSPFVPV